MSEASGPANHRLKAYKNKALDTQELRRRREEEGIQLRKQKRDEHVRVFGDILVLFVLNRKIGTKESYML